jgi:hypothetical protein
LAIDDLPLPVVNFLNVIGVPWPYIDEDEVAQFATFVRQFATAVWTTHDDATRAVADIAGAYQGSATDAMSSGWARMSTKHVDELVDGCHVLADALDVAAGYIVAQKAEAVAVLIGMAAAFVADQAAAVATSTGRSRGRSPTRPRDSRSTPRPRSGTSQAADPRRDAARPRHPIQHLHRRTGLLDHGRGGLSPALAKDAEGAVKRISDKVVGFAEDGAARAKASIEDIAKSDESAASACPAARPLGRLKRQEWRGSRASSTRSAGSIPTASSTTSWTTAAAWV